ncbi:MAG: NADH dehydrogenase FAD-containing subunit [Nitrospirota bacterium]
MILSESMLIAMPALFAALSIGLKAIRAVSAKAPFFDKTIIVTAAVTHLVMTLLLQYGQHAPDALIGADALNYLFLLILSTLFLASALYSTVFIAEMTVLIREAHDEKYNHWYVPTMLFTLSTLSGVILSRNLGLMWVFIEATTLSTAPLILHHKGKESLEAVWKYLFICSVGIALAFIGVLAMTEAGRSIKDAGLNVDALSAGAANISQLWGGIAFVFALVGFGTKMGLAPMHTWLPDAHSQAPSPASAMFSGALTISAFLCILRYYQIFSSTPMIGFIRQLMLILGLVSLFVSAVYVIRAGNFKRKLAYSTIEHMGILAIGMGLGGGAIYAVMLHTLCSSLAKHSLFLTSGNFLHVYGTVNVKEIRGGVDRVPQSAWLLVTGTLALLGFPPWAIFITEFSMLRQMVTDGRWFILSAFAIFLTVIIYGFAAAVMRMAFSKGQGEPHHHEPLLSTLPQWTFIAALAALGIHIPAHLNTLLHQAAAALGGH